MPSTRRHFLSGASLSLGSIALGVLWPRASVGSASAAGRPELPHFPPRAKRVIYLFQSGGPAQQELFDYKPLLDQRHGQELPDHVRGGPAPYGHVRQPGFDPAGPVRFSASPVMGKCGAWLSELLPHTASVVDDLCIIRSMYTEAINHDPAITFFQTGSQIAGRPSMGSWISYGLGSMNENLPAFVVLVTPNKGDQPLYARLWGNGFLDSRYQGVRFGSGRDPVFYLTNPEGVSAAGRRLALDTLGALNRIQQDRELDPEIEARMAQYEMAYRMQTSVPEVMDIAGEPQHILDLYGPDVRDPGTFARNCLLARRLAERGVRFIQLYHQGWDHHGNLPAAMRVQSRETDQPTAALIKDLKQRGMLDDTLVIWGGEFGRTSYCQGRLESNNYGRDHHPRCFTVWLAGGGVKGGLQYGQTDAYGYNIADAEGNPDQPRTEPLNARSGTRPRFASHHLAPVGHRPHSLDLSISRPPLPPHRRAWPRC